MAFAFPDATTMQCPTDLRIYSIDVRITADTDFAVKIRILQLKSLDAALLIAQQLEMRS